jgi:pimeloyl-ACP methyl ester carboxylesterase
MRYLNAGSGPPILLIHGLMAYSFSWRLTIPALKTIRTVYAPDMLGLGYSDHPPGLDYGLTASAQRLWAFIDAVGIETTDVVGSSLGGALAVCMAATYPERINKLVLAAPVNPWSRHGRWITRLLATKPGGKAFIAALPLVRATGQVWLNRLFGDTSRIPPGTLDGYTAPLAHPAAWDFGLSVMQHWRADLRQLELDYAALAEKPALLIWGRRDRAVHAYSAQEICKRMPEARLELLPGVGHMPYEEVPDKFNSLVAEFLTA